MPVLGAHQSDVLDIPKLRELRDQVLKLAPDEQQYVQQQYDILWTQMVALHAWDLLGIKDPKTDEGGKWMWKHGTIHRRALGTWDLEPKEVPEEDAVCHSPNTSEQSLTQRTVQIVYRCWRVVLLQSADGEPALATIACKLSTVCVARHQELQLQVTAGRIELEDGFSR